MKYNNATTKKSSLTVREPMYSSMHVKEATIKWHAVKIVFSISGAMAFTSSVGTVLAVMRH